MLPDILRKPFLVHDTAPTGVWGLDEATLEFLFQAVANGHRTLETGAGLSTVLFALKRASHICVVPVRSEADRIVEHCSRQGIDTTHVEFVVARSERALPGMRVADLDLVLIDGCHGFPAPIVDWFYTAPMLKVGGRLLLDDTRLWSVRILCDFLARDPAWRLECDLPKTAVFVKLAEGSEHREWVHQPYVVMQTDELARVDARGRRRREVLGLLKQGKILGLADRIWHAMGRRLRRTGRSHQG